MSKIEGWSRAKDEEYGGVNYAWRHDDTGEMVMVSRDVEGSRPPLDNRYEVYATPGGGKDFYDIAYKEKVETARMAAVEWMKEHPNAEYGDER